LYRSSYSIARHESTTDIELIIPEERDFCRSIIIERRLAITTIERPFGEYRAFDIFHGICHYDISTYSSFIFEYYDTFWIFLRCIEDIAIYDEISSDDDE
jgi:superfamily II helicase